MNALDWFLSIALFTIYVVCLFTVCALTFRKGYTLLGIIGIFLPILWLIGAILPPKRGSRMDVQQAQQREVAIADMTR
jgi:hypothetical protein